MTIRHSYSIGTTIFSRAARRRAGAALMLAGAVLWTVLAVGCATNPVTGKRQFSLVTSDQEIQMGKEGHAAILQEYGAYDDPKLQALVDSIGNVLAKASHMPNLEWHFTVLDDPIVNAFALPGGYIYITRGILSHLNSEAQLAGVLGHEIGHVTARHSAQRMTQQQISGLGLGVASIFSRTLRRYGEVANQALGLMMLKYGRDDENQADELGVQYSAKVGYDPREIPATYHMLARIGEHAGQRLPTFLSTHPDPGDRETRTTALAAQAVVGKTGLVVRGAGYVRRLDGVVYGMNPRQGYFNGQTFYHPELRVQIQFPDGWKTQNARTAVMAVEPNQKAQMQVTLANAGGKSPEAFVAELQSGGKILGAEGRAETIGGHPAWVGRIEVPGQSGANSSVVAAAWIKMSAENTFQVIGLSATPGDANEAKVMASARTLRDLTDPAKLEAKPDRVDVVSVSAAGTFSQVVGKLTPLAAQIDELSILNNVETDEDVRTGQLLKVVRPGPR